MVKYSLGQLFRADRPIFQFLQSIGTQVIVLGLNLATGIVTARMLGPEGRGVFAALVTWPLVLALFALAGMKNSVSYHLLKTPERWHSIVPACFLVVACMASAWALAGWIAMPFVLKQYGPEVISFARLCLIGVYITVFHMTAKQVMTGSKSFKLYNLHETLLPGVYLALFIGYTMFYSLTAESAAVCSLVAGFLVLLLSLYQIAPFERRPIREIWDRAKEVATYGFLAAPPDIIGMAGVSVDKLVLVTLLSAEDLGLYVVAFSLSRLIMIIHPPLATVVFARMTQKEASGAKELHDHAFRVGLHATFIMFGVLLLVDRFAITFLYGESFAGAVPLFRILVVDSVLSILCYITTQLYLALNRPGLVSSLQIVPLSTAIVLILTLTPLYGAQGAAWALVLSSLVKLCTLLACIKLRLGLSFPRLYLLPRDLAYFRGLLGEGAVR
jgi:antigen flippase